MYDSNNQLCCIECKIVSCEINIILTFFMGRFKVKVAIMEDRYFECILDFTYVRYVV